MLTQGMVEHYVTDAALAHERRRAEKLASFDSAKALAARQAEIAQAVRALLGDCPLSPTLNVHTIAVHERDEYAIELLTFESFAGVVVPANLYLPRGRTEPWPAVVVFSGDAPDGKIQAERQRLGQLLARRGIAALFFDSPGQGERLEFYDSTLRRSWVGRTVAVERAHLGHPFLLTGNNLAYWMAMEGARALEVLAARPEIDAKRMGVCGDGSSEALARILCCLDARVSAAAIVADNCDPHPLGGETIENTLPGAMALSFPPLALLTPFAPKPLLLDCCVAEKALSTHQEAVKDLASIYALLGKAQNFSSLEERGVRGFSKFMRMRISEHFAGAFGLGIERLRELETPAETPDTLRCTETGQVGNSLNAASLFSVHSKLAHELPPAVALPADESSADALRADLRARFGPLLHLPETSEAVRNEVESRTSDWGLQVEKGRLLIAEGLYVPYSFYMRPPATDSGTRVAAPVLLALHERGIAGVTGAGEWMRAIPQAGFHVMAIDVAGIGETRMQAEREDGEGYEAMLCGPETLWARRALNAGLNLFGLGVFSVLRSIEYLKSRWDVDRNRIALSGTGRGALWGLYAAALNKDVSRLAMLRGLSTYKCLVERCRHNHHFSLYLPGCLKSFDLPHVAACVAPRPLTLINSVDQRKERRPLEKMRRDYAFTADMYRIAGAAERFALAVSDSAPESLETVLKAIGGK
ncbi:MAG TPA: acetylxylan esterase [Planctomycetota bacterium]|nr:acetylxylan esterase [Planctomycetota bacterium]